MIIENWNRQEKSVIIIEKNGQVESDRVIKDNEEVIIKDKGKKLTAKQRYFLNQRNEFKKHCNSLGGFINMIYAKNEILFNNTNIDKSNVSRIIYLSTYMDYQQKGLIVYQLKSKEGKFQPNEPMNKKQIQTTLNLGDTAFKKFLKDMKENSLIYEVDKRFYINTEYFIKGEVEEMDKANQSYCRLFIDTIRAIYESCKAKEHKTLATVYQLIPFVHYSNNMICNTPNELESNSNPMSLKEIGALLNLEDSKGNLRKLVKELESIKVIVKDKEYKLFAYIYMSDKDFFFINPYVVYSGNDINKLRWVADTYFFRGQNK